MATTKKTATEATKKPTGVKISRNGDVYTASWTIADKDYDLGQTFQYRTKRGGKWGPWLPKNGINPGKKATSRKMTFPKANLPPNKGSSFDAIEVRVRGRRNTYKEKRKYKDKKNKTKTAEYTITCTMSEWSNATYTVELPTKPTVSSSWNSSLENKTTFSWSLNPAPSSTDKKVFTYTKIQTCLLKNDATATSKIANSKWTTVDSKRDHSSSYSPTETLPSSATFDKKGAASFPSYTRHVRVCSRGPKGDSGWAYAKHVYAMPYRPYLEKGRVSNNASRGMTCSVQWTAPQDAKHPIDSVEVQYAIAVFASGKACPSNASWQTVHTLQDTLKTKKNPGDNDFAAFNIDARLQEDEGFFVRVNAKHDNNINYGAPVRYGPGDTRLAAPSGLHADAIDPVTHKTYVTCTNNSAVPDSRILITFVGTKANKKTDVINVGIIPHVMSGQPYRVTCPSPSAYTSYAFRARAFVQGDNYITSTKKTSESVTYYEYTIKSSPAPLYSSVISYGGQVPVAPTNVNLTKKANGNVFVSWTWSWTTAEYVELSWADHNDAWDSTDEPQTYRVPTTHVRSWTIANLEEGKIWYIRARFIEINYTDNSETLGPWSEIKQINLSSEPNKPVLALPSIATIKQKVTATWVYSTTDTTSQATAAIKEVTVNSSTGAVTKYGDTIATVKTAQSVVIDISKTSWKVGSTHYLSLQVTSASGISSQWSDPVKIAVADPLTCQITQTSFVKRTVFSLTGNDTVSRIYPLTKDAVPDSSKNYYTSSIVESPSDSDIYNYYELINEGLNGTDDQTVDATEVLIEQIHEFNDNDVSKYYELIDDSYVLTLDIAVSSTKVSAPSNDDISNYYERADSAYIKTDDIVVAADVVNEPDASDIANYYEFSDDTYTKTEDEDIDDTKTYYTIDKDYYVIDKDYYISSANVENCYEKSIDDSYVKTDDVSFDSSKTYYTLNKQYRNLTYVPNPVSVQPVSLQFSLEQGYWAAADGEPGDAARWVRTTKTACIPNTEYRYLSDYNSTWLGVAYYTSNGVYISSDGFYISTAAPVNYTYKTPSNASYLAVSIRSAESSNNGIITPEDVSDLTIVKSDEIFYEADLLYHTAEEVVSPVIADIGTYYEFDSGEMVLTKDTDIVSGKTYYTMERVVYPNINDLEHYYEPSTYDCIDSMPITITAKGSGSTGTTTIYIERAEDFHQGRPDEDEFNGFEGETVAQKSQKGESQVTFNLEDLIGNLDDGAKYRVLAVASDNLGQSATASKEFTVRWAHQAIIPEADVEFDYEYYAAKITPHKPLGWLEGDVCDIYRLSVDKPVLIIQDGDFETVYVDPYPTIGEYSGYRVVFKTINGDYITKENMFAWVDVGEEYFDTPYNIFDFADGQVRLLYNIDLSNSWRKDFKETQYLGGHIQGDWNAGVSRTGSVNSVSVLEDDVETIKAMRRLADYPGICHVRTRDGSSYAANVEVSENMPHDQWDLVSYSLSITRVDPEGFDGMTIDEWNRLHPTEQE